MTNTSENINCGGFVFFNNFDSANLAKVEEIKIPEISDKGNGIISCHNNNIVVDVINLN